MGIFKKEHKSLLLTWLFSLAFFITPLYIQAQDDSGSESIKPEMLMDVNTSKDFFKSLQISVIEHPIFLSSEANLAQSKEVLTTESCGAVRCAFAPPLQS